MSEIPVHLRPRRLVDWIDPTGAREVHSLVDKVYQRKNLEMAWEKVKAARWPWLSCQPLTKWTCLG
jgi:RNA-directed DNA polymerase